MKIAIIGAGLSGLILANDLNKNHDVTVFEKSRGVSGRMTTRRSDDYRFDHGAQFFTARCDDFKAFLKPYIDQNIVSPWDPEITTIENGEIINKRKWSDPHFVSAPAMNTLCKELAQNIDIQLNTRITALNYNDNHWTLQAEEKQIQTQYDTVLITAPSHQAFELLPDYIAFKNDINNVKMMGCFATMAGLAEPIKTPWHVASFKNSLLSLAVANSHKPGRNQNAQSILIHTHNNWAEQHIEQEANDVQKIILKEFYNQTGVTLDHAEYLTTHKWRYANTEIPAKQKSYWDKNNKIGVCGDWCITGHIESAYQSSQDLLSKL